MTANRLATIQPRLAKVDKAVSARILTYRYRNPPEHGLRLVAVEAEHWPVAARGNRARHVLGC